MSQINNLSILKTWLICYIPVYYVRIGYQHFKIVKL